jgi:hypothetical protein
MIEECDAVIFVVLAVDAREAVLQAFQSAAD